jgi:serine protease Do
MTRYDIVASAVGAVVLAAFIGFAVYTSKVPQTVSFYDSVTVLVADSAGDHGSGVIYKDADGKLRVLTAHHVVKDDPEKMFVDIGNGVHYPFRVTFAKDDYAILDVDNLPRDHAAAHVSCRAPVLNETVEIVGFPMTLLHVHTRGAVASSERKLVEGLEQAGFLVPLDAAATFGNSGGPVFDRDGNVIGIMTAILATEAGQTGISFMSPTDTLCAALPRL